MSERDGGPAFPTLHETYDGMGQISRKSSGGMTLRQWYAGMALQGMLASSMDYPGGPQRPNVSLKDEAQIAFAYADAMLAQEVGDE